MKKKSTLYCKYHHNCDKDIDCFNGEDCSIFEHSEDFSSLKYTKEEVLRFHAETFQDAIDSLFDHVNE